MLYGGHGADTYLINQGDGQDILVETLCEDLSMDRVLFGDNIQISNLWFSVAGNDLLITLLGSTDKVSVHDWVTQSNTIEQYVTSDGFGLSADNVHQLVDAMAAYEPTTDGTVSLTADEQLQIDAVIAATWQLL